MTRTLLRRKNIPWLRLLIGLLAGLFGLWFITRNLEFSDVQEAFGRAKMGYIVLAVGVILTTILTKTWRWQLLFINNGRLLQEEEAAPALPSLPALFWPLILGQFINAVSPVRVGELARVIALERETGIDKVQGLGTLVVEKTLDIIALVLTLFLILPTVVLPASLTLASRGEIMALTAVFLFGLLLIFAYFRERITKLASRIIRRLPARLQNPLMRLIVSGLTGLSALRQPRQLLVLTFISAVIMVLHILTPYVLFFTFGLPFGLKEAALLHLTLNIISQLPASSPVNVGIFEGLVAFMLNQFGLNDNAAILSYAIVYHLVVVMPQIVLGSFSVIRKYEIE
ncbi:MAG: lysylphosphatidylglycerol synthase transmembrane domain-containing protein [Candidatus Promineifilaceae bacterium]